MAPNNRKMGWQKTSVLAVFCFCASFSIGTSYMIDNSPYRHAVTLDSQGKYLLNWEPNFETKMVTFNVTVTTTGYIGFGLAMKGKMAGADIVIGGVDSKGKPYFSDRHAIGNQLPKVDASQDWTLHSARESGGKTYLSFSRAFDTCDADHDLPITDDVISIIWAYGEIDDELQYHFQNRGQYPVYLLDPDLTPRGIENIQERRDSETNSGINVFSITGQTVLPAQETMYWCSFHKVPTRSKRHIIGFDTQFPDQRNRSHVHHLLLHRCQAPDGVDPEAFFEGPARSGGSECYFLGSPNNPLPTQYCRETIFVWAVGGRPVFFPDNVGLPMSQYGSEYFVLQVHYDNPNSVPDLPVTVELKAYYTNEIRENDAGMLPMGEIIPGSTSIIIPPNSLDHVIIGHCAEECTSRIFSEDGANVFAAFLHTHISGRGVRYLVVRDNQELPYLAFDDNYDFNYQQFRILREERKILPGDQLMIRCVYDTTPRNGTAVVGGFSTRQEMCTGFLYYYNKPRQFSFCRSEIQSEIYWNRLGIRNASWVDSRREVIISSPPQYAGLSMSDFANNHVDWDLEMRKEIQRDHKFLPQVSECRIVQVEPPRGSTPTRTPRPRLNRLSAVPPPYQDNTQTEYVSINPTDIPRYRRPPQCTRDWRNVFSKNDLNL